VALPPPKPPKPGAPATSAGGPPRPNEDVLARAKREKDELEGATQELEEELESLKAKYEQYFLGVERREPSRWREDVKKKVLRLKSAFTRNTGLKFRIQSLYARYLSYERMWQRSVREKEEGTYRRDVFKAKMRAKHDEPPPEPAPPPAPVAKKPAAPAAPAAAAKGAPPAPKPVARPAAPAPKGPMSDAALRTLYDQYVAAKRSCREDVSKLTYEAVASTVSKQIPELMTRFKAKSVEFKVEVKDGRAVLKAIPKV
jgi:hypothetical protein